MRKRALFLRLALPLALLWAAETAHAQSGRGASESAIQPYPMKPIRIITGSSPGSSDDFFARALGGNPPILIGDECGESVLLSN